MHHNKISRGFWIQKEQNMIDTIRVIAITEESESKTHLHNSFRDQFSQYTHTETLVSGLAAFKDNEFDMVLLSYDVEDFYSVNDVIKILLESDFIRKIVVVSETVVPSIESTDDRLQPLLMESPEKTMADILEIAEILQSSLEREGLLERGTAAIGKDGIGALLFDTIPIGLFRIDPEGNFVDCNHTLVTIFKAPNREVILGDSLFALFSDSEEIDNWLDIIHKDSRIRGLVFEAEQYDGQKIWLRNNTKSIHDAEGKVIYYDGTLEDVTFQKKLEDRLSFLATHDILTGLPNRNFFQLQSKLTLSQARYSGDMVAFLLLDIDHFAAINNHGSRVGDQVLQLTAERAKVLLRKSDLIARLGGDKFIVLLPSIKSRQDILAVAKKMSSMYKDPVVIDDITLKISISMGISIFPNHGETENALIHRAEIATLAVKERERGGYLIYSDSIKTRAGA
jgi:diguanylate cyclase (GGDEF)-like protein/PAS domain S-box-containing protein